MRKGLLSLIVIFFSCQEEDKQEQKNQQLPQVVEVTTLPTPQIEKIGKLEQQLLDQGLVNIQELDSSIIVDLKYSTTDNFFGEDVYGELTKAYVQPSVGKDLTEAHKALKSINPHYRFYVFDIVRPLSIQKILWNSLDSIPPGIRKAYVADPAEGSIHNYGSAVDLSIYDLEADTLLDMGTNFDHFGALAYPRKEKEMYEQGRLTLDQIENREILRLILAEKGFTPITSEWWHFNRYSRAKAKSMFQIVE